MAPADPHSFSDSSAPFINHVLLSLYLDFPSTTIRGHALLSLPQPHSGTLSLDTRSLSVHSVKDPVSGNSVPFSLSENPDPIKGTLLTLVLSSQSSFVVDFSTSPDSSALQWLTPPQTHSKTHPFVYTQCQPIHARSIFPCNDTPAARIKFLARLNIPADMSAVMSAAHTGRRMPETGEGPDDSEWCAEDRMVEEFTMEQPIPPYLFAFAVGRLTERTVGPRTKVYGELGAEIVELAAREFEGTEELIRQGEKLFGQYEWERFDLLVLPASFPYGGMENPRMVFLTPTVIAGDGSGAQVVAHELAHSWTGNLITNASNNDFWLNEGFTTYAERRIVEVVQGEERCALNTGIGWRGLHEEMERFKDSMKFTKLRQDQEGVDPDEIYSRVPYEKGFQFLWRIERQVGRGAFDEFLKKYIAKFKFQSIDTETFLLFLKETFPGIENQVDLDTWVDGTGIPLDAMEPVSELYTKIISFTKDFNKGRVPTEEDTANWGGQEWELYLDNLPKNVDPSQVQALDDRYFLAEHKNWEVKVAFLTLASWVGCRKFMGGIEKTLKEVGRMKYLRPLYTALLQGSLKDEGKVLAKRVFPEACDSYHPIAKGVVESILCKDA